MTCSAEGDFDVDRPRRRHSACTGSPRKRYTTSSTHAGARRAEVRLLRIDDSAELTIADDGKGFDIAETRKSGKGLGLVSINERVRLAGGTLSVVTEWARARRYVCDSR